VQRLPRPDFPLIQHPPASHIQHCDDSCCPPPARVPLYHSVFPPPVEILFLLVVGYFLSFPMSAIFNKCCFPSTFPPREEGTFICVSLTVCHSAFPQCASPPRPRLCVCRTPLPVIHPSSLSGFSFFFPLPSRFLSLETSPRKRVTKTANREKIVIAADLPREREGTPLQN